MKTIWPSYNTETQAALEGIVCLVPVCIKTFNDRCDLSESDPNHAVTHLPPLLFLLSFWHSLSLRLSASSPSHHRDGSAHLRPAAAMHNWPIWWLVFAPVSRECDQLIVSPQCFGGRRRRRRRERNMSVATKIEPNVISGVWRIWKAVWPRAASWVRSGGMRSCFLGRTRFKGTGVSGFFFIVFFQD